MIYYRFVKGCTQMGLYINHEHHNGMYTNMEKINEPNQTTFRRDHLAELLKAQQKNDDLLHKSIQQLSMINEQRDNRQFIQWREVNSRLSGLEKVNDQLGSQVMEQLKALTDENEKIQIIIENKHRFDKEIIHQIEQFSLNNEKVAQQLLEQKESQQAVIKRLDDQEALTEKALRQVSNLRSSLFERTNYLAETIEDRYKLISSYLYKLFTGADQPLTFYMHNEDKIKDSQ